MMRIGEYARLAARELQDILEQLKDEQLNDLADLIRGADRVFVAGAGRAGLMARAFAMRLMQAGLTVYVAGETVTPSITGKDLLIIASGSGSTQTMQAIARKGREAGAGLALITASPDSPIGRLADCLVEIPAFTCGPGARGPQSMQPGASAFEQCLLLAGDAVAASILPGGDAAAKNLTLMKNHANLE